MTDVGNASQSRTRRFSPIAIATLVVAIVRLVTRQASHWELDEYLFRMGIESFDPLRHHPHPPGYPLLIGLGQIADAIVGDPFVAMIAVAWLSSVIGFFAFALAIREITGSEAIAVTGALLFNLSPAMLVHGSEPMSDPPALMFLALALLAATRVWKAPTISMVVALAASCAASIGCRPQYAVPIVPVFLVMLALRGSLRVKCAGLVAFTAACLVWFVPLVVATGGLRELVAWETGQAAYVAAHDAHLSRGTRSWFEIALRFVAHPWGPKVLAFPTLLLAAFGGAELVRRRLTIAWPVIAVSVLHLGFTMATSDPADGVRYQLPAQMMVAFLAALGIDMISRVRHGRVALVLVPLVLVTGFSIYAWPVVKPRAVEPSPPARAIEWANANLSKRSIVLWDASLRAHADATLRGFTTMPVERGLASYYDKPATELWILADGLTRVPGATSFSWPESDAYGKLTRNHYRVVSLIPLVPERRYLPLKGVNLWERDADRPEWRWLDQVASVRIPPGVGDLRLRFDLPKEVPYETVKVTIKVDDLTRTQIVIGRGSSGETVVPISDGRYAEVEIVSSEAFTPAAATGRDPRRLALTLTDLVRVPHAVTER